MIETLIFDFDGVIVDTETPDFASWEAIFRSHGVGLDRSLWARIIGGSVEWFDAYQHLQELVGTPIDREAIRETRRKTYLDVVKARPPLPGVLDYLSDAKQLGLKLGVASSSSNSSTPSTAGTTCVASNPTRSYT